MQKKLGARPGGCAFDLSAACAGFLYGLSIADSFIRAGQFKRVLVVGVEVLSRIIDWTDRNTCVLFGDGAGAVLLPPTRAASAACCRRTSTPTARWPRSCCMPAGGSREPLTPEGIAAQAALRAR